MTKEELSREIEEAYGYDDYMRDKYRDFQEFLDDHLYGASHRNQAERYQEAVYKLDNLVRKVYNENN